MRLIDADALNELIDGGYDLDFDEVPETKRELLRLIDDQETIDAVPVVHGRWKGEGMGDYSCSLCGFVVSGNGYRFCPNCGAKTLGEISEEKRDDTDNI